MKRLDWRVTFAFFLVGLSVVLYWCHYLIFKDPHHIFIYLLGDIAFAPIDVLLVVLILEQLLKRREKKALLQKLNMVVGVFFSEVGQPFLQNLNLCPQRLSERLLITGNWKPRDYARLHNTLLQHNFEEMPIDLDLNGLKELLIKKRPFLLRLLENPNLLEHERITDMLWAIFHLTEELSCRDGLEKLPSKDRKHLLLDLNRAYSKIVREWVEYMRHLQTNYPYLFSLAVRMNPFNPKRCAEVKT